MLAEALRCDYHSLNSPTATSSFDSLYYGLYYGRYYVLGRTMLGEEGEEVDARRSYLIGMGHAV